MGEKTKIEWTAGGATWTPIRARNLKTGKVGWHCEHDTTGCELCYAEGLNKRLGTGLPFKPGHRRDIELFLDERMLEAPLRWKRPRMVFVCSMTDLFASFVPDEWIDRMFAVMAFAGNHTFQVLTKRPDRMRKAVERMGRQIDTLDRQMRLMGRTLKFEGLGLVPWPLPNVWLGVSAERQQEADERVPVLLQTAAAVRFVSAEPLLGPIDFGRIVRGGLLAGKVLSDGKVWPINWIIVGGESGPKHRAMEPWWAADIIKQCQDAGIAPFMKQMAGKEPIPPELMVRQFPHTRG